MKKLSDVAQQIRNILPGSMKRAGTEEGAERQRAVSGFGESIERCIGSDDYKNGIARIIQRLKAEFEHEHLKDDLDPEKEQFTRGKLKAIITLEDRINQSIVAGRKATEQLNDSNQEK